MGFFSKKHSVPGMASMYRYHFPVASKQGHEGAYVCVGHEKYLAIISSLFYTQAWAR